MEPTAKCDFLMRFEERVRGSLGNLFHGAVRTGAATASEVVNRVRAAALGALHSPWISPQREASLRALLQGLEEDAAGARAYAQHCLWWNSLPAEERVALKEQRSAEHARGSMAGQPVTEPQRRFLRELGCDEEPPDRLAASQMIDALLSARQKPGVPR